MVVQIESTINTKNSKYPKQQKETRRYTSPKKEKLEPMRYI